MCDFRKLNDMVLASLPFVEEWSRVQAHRDQLEVALAGVAALMLAVGSQYNHSLLAVLCSVAGHVLAAGDPDAGDLSPANWVLARAHPCSVITWVLSLTQAQAHLLAFQLAAALEMVSQWIMADSTLIGPEARLTFRHLKTVLFDIPRTGSPGSWWTSSRVLVFQSPVSRVPGNRPGSRRDQPKKGRILDQCGSLELINLSHGNGHGILILRMIHPVVMTLRALAEQQHNELGLPEQGIVCHFWSVSLNRIYLLILFRAKCFVFFYSPGALSVVAKRRWAINHDFSELTAG